MPRSAARALRNVPPDDGRDVDRTRAAISRHGDIIIAPDRGLFSVAPGRAGGAPPHAAPSTPLRTLRDALAAPLRWADAPGPVRARDPRRRCRHPAVAALTPRAPEVPAGPHGGGAQPPAGDPGAPGTPRGPPADRGDRRRARGRRAGAARI